MLDIPGYQIIELIYQSQKILVYRGHKKQIQGSVILKTLRADYPTVTDIAKLKHEYEISKNLDLAGIVKPYRLETYKNSPLLILEDFGGKALTELIASKKITLQRCLSIAIQLAKTIGNLHKKQIIHKDIKPQNIIINPETEQVKITDFSISSMLSKESQTISSPKLLEGTLAYMSPEQTGRMNRVIDYRTDFYSLGATLYEMLTGQLPFQETDPMELVHCHIAKQPIAPHIVNPEIPSSVSILVMKLLSKMAEDRYQNAYGIKVDLEDCLSQLINTGKIEYFTPGQQDLSGRFEVPQKLYGRESQLAALMDAFNRVRQGTIEMLLIAGYSGIGKSALVNEIYKPIVHARGYFISGKFDQYKRNIPYASLIQAFRNLMRQMLTESEAQVQIWKQELLAALGPNGQVIIDVIPEVQLIVGPQSPVVQLGPAESQNRFNLVFKNFIHVFTQKEHPLALFLDDLQWADSASLKLIQLLMTDPDGQYLLMIGAYRDNEVSLTDPLILTLDEIQQVGASVNTLTLQPLSLTHISQLIADTLRLPLTKVQPLAELLLKKTDGNPFFLTQLFKYLYLESFLVFNFSAREWQWNLELIQGIGITDNVVELMVQKIQELSESTQNILKLAACIGNQFDLDVLSIVNEKSRSATAAELWEALKAGLIIPLSNAYKIPLLLEHFNELVVDYKFLHDRVQQGAYTLIPENQRKEVHLKVGQLLLRNANTAELEENIFDIVNHLNISAELITAEPEQRDQLAELNLIAGQKAKAATAYESALKYLTVGLGLLTENSWQRQYNLTLNLYVEVVEVEYLNTHFERAQRLSEVVFEKATNLLDKVKVYELKIQFYIAENQMLEAIDTALPVLELLGYPLPQISTELSLVAELPKLSNLEGIPKMTDPAQLAALQILTIITGPAYMAKPEILPVIVFKMVNLCLEYGHSALAAYAYGMYGLLLCGPLGDIETGYHSGQLSLHLLEQFDIKELTCKIYMLFNSFVRHWKEQGKETISSFLETIQTGFETGDIVYAAYCCMWSCSYLFLIGEPLDSLEQKQRQYVNLLEKIKQEYGLYPAKIWRQLTLNLQSRAADKFNLIGNSFSEADMEHLHSINNRMLLFFVYLAKLILAYFFKENAVAVAHAKIADEYEDAATASMLIGAYKFYNSLAQLGMYPTATPSEQLQYLKLVEISQKKMKHWAYHSPMNYQHKYDLVEAEKARVLGQIVEAMELYDRAIQGAREQGYLQEEALAYERAAEFYLSIGREEIAQLYITKAHYGYFRWGATAKVKDLESEYPQLISKASTNYRKGTQNTSMASSISMTSNDAVAFDLTTVLKASQALASEIILDKLLVKLMNIVIENAGAQKGFLILDREDNWVIEAKGAVDDDVTVLQSIPIESIAADYQTPLVSASIINYVIRTRENVVLNDATKEGQFNYDPYIIATQPKSILCAPLLHQGKLSGILYLENDLTTGAFTPDHVEVLRILSSQAAISIQNSRLYEQLEDYSRTLEQKVGARTQELKEKNEQLETTLQKLKATQDKIIAQEKLASLGGLTAGIAHEIKNPLNFVNNFAELSVELTQELLGEIENQKDRLDSETRESIEEILNALSQNTQKINEHGRRADNIVRRMLMHARGQTGKRQLTDINTLLAESLNLAYHGRRAKDSSFNITIETDYDNDLDQLNVVPQDISRVFLNVISNACYAAHERKQEIGEGFSPTLLIGTKDLGERVEIRIRDNGKGIPRQGLDKIFNPFFTTKPTGQGTGLGLSISYDIIVQGHQGEIRVETEVENYAEFIIVLPKIVADNHGLRK